MITVGACKDGLFSAIQTLLLESKASLRTVYMFLFWKMLHGDETVVILNIQMQFHCPMF